MRGMSPKVTVFVPVYNRVRYVGAAIESVLAQSFTDFELLVVDDGSTDGSADTVRRFADPRIRLVANDGNQGIPYTRNRGLELARGAYIAMLDSDDVAAPRRLERQVAFLDRHPDVATLGGWVEKFDGSGRRIKRLVKPLVPDELKAWLLFRCCHANTTMMGRTAVLRECGYRAEFPVSEDFDLSVRLAAAGHRAANLPRTLTFMREHGGRITGERADQVRATKLDIAGRQLAALGAAHEPADLDRHFLLMRGKQRGAAPDLAFLDWAEDWLAAILAANRSVRLYSERGLANVFGQVWLHSCWQAAPRIGRGRALARLSRSPLRVGVASTLVDNVAFAAGRRG